jgi:protein O-GlcNAc transferase
MQGQPHLFLGLIYFQQRKYSESLPFLVRACLLSPLDAWAHYSLGTSYVWCLEPEKAIESFDHCLRLDPEFHRARFARTMANIPMVYHSQPEIELWRGRYSDSFQELVLHYTHASAEHRSAAAEVIGVNQPYFLPYQASDDRKLQEALGGLSCMLMSARYPQFSGELEMPSVSDHERLRIGFLSAFFKEHSNWKMPIRGWIENLDRTRFEVFGYYTSTGFDNCTRSAQSACDHFVTGLSTPDEWASRILGDRLHILVFPGLGMDTMVGKLACLRMAPVQCNAVGHPVTSGLGTMDYYLSSEFMEPSAAREHYSETLVELPDIGVDYEPVWEGASDLTRQSLHIELNSIVYCCCQSLYKYLPRDDHIFPRIAQIVPQSVFVFISHRSDNITNTFASRLEIVFRSHGLDWRKHCVIEPRLSPKDFNALLSHSDVFLDTIDWNGMNTVMEALHYDIPIVTLAGEFMRGRHAQAILRMIDVQETIAETAEHFIEIAARLGIDSKWRQVITQKIHAQKSRAYADLSTVKHLQDFFEFAVRQPGRNKR